METEEEIDLWNPTISSEGTLLDKVLVNFSGRIINNKTIKTNINELDKREKEQFNEMNEEPNTEQQWKMQENEKLKKLTEEIFADDDSDNDNMMFDVTGLKERLKQELLKDDFYDPLKDDKYEE